MDVPRFKAAIMPSGTASTTAKSTPATPSLTVFSARSPIESSVDVPPPRQEVPKSPWSRSSRKLPYWTWSGSLRPSSSRKRSLSSVVVVSGGSMVSSGLPTLRETKKTMVTTNNVTKIAWISRMMR